MDLNEIYKKEKIINSHFRKKYDYNNEEIFNKQVLELLCELSEFAYETKCFKYWKKYFHNKFKRNKYSKSLYSKIWWLFYERMYYLKNI